MIDQRAADSTLCRQLPGAIEAVDSLQAAQSMAPDGPIANSANRAGRQRQRSACLRVAPESEAIRADNTAFRPACSYMPASFPL